VNSGSVTVGSGTSTGTLNIGAGLGAPPAAPGTLNTASVALSSSGTINFNHTATDYVFAPVISGNGSVNVLAGTTTLTATSTSYTGPATVNAGALFVDGSIASSSVTVGSGATLGGTGTVGPTVINAGGFLAPGHHPAR
jgi:autotransporter-associated beta strand protein